MDDDLGLSAPGTRNISIDHQFKYYNYTEINKLNSEPEYRFQKGKESNQINEAKQYTDEQRQKYIDRKNKVRPGQQAEDDS